MRALIGKIILILNELHYWSIRGGYFTRLVSVLILGGILSVPILVLAGPALMIFAIAKDSSRSEVLYGIGEVWLFSVIGLILVAIIFLIIRRVKQIISLRKYARPGRYKRPHKRN